MGRAEGIHDEDIEGLRQLGSEGRIVLLLLGVKAHVLEEDDLPLGQGVQRGLHLGAHAVIDEQDLDPIGPLHVRDDLLQGQERIERALGAAEVGDERHLSAPVQKLAQGALVSPDSCVVGNPSVLEGDVEIDPHQNFFILYVLKTERFQFHLRPLPTCLFPYLQPRSHPALPSRSRHNRSIAANDILPYFW